ncbi:hypothetical protein GCM10009838_07420 [Catenulispora subtropica]|uniref:Uncharacterized protein n=1 Tax=Catenulispora subtropica TaxID=450798 RepID=A0ABN2QL83_9ACTN
MWQAVPRLREVGWPGHALVVQPTHRSRSGRSASRVSPAARVASGGCYSLTVKLTGPDSLAE